MLFIVLYSSVVSGSIHPANSALWILVALCKHNHNAVIHRNHMITTESFPMDGRRWIDSAYKIVLMGKREENVDDIAWKLMNEPVAAKSKQNDERNYGNNYTSREYFMNFTLPFIDY